MKYGILSDRTKKVGGGGEGGRDTVLQNVEDSVFMFKVCQERVKKNGTAELEFENVYRAQESIPPACVAWRADTSIELSYQSARLGIDSWFP
jgi:hypothetical protein